METPQIRLKTFIDKKFISIREFAKQMEMRDTDVQKYINKGTSVLSAYDKIEKLSQMGLNIEWYTEGKGEMLNPKKSARGQSDFDMSKAEGVAFIALPDIRKMTLEDMEKKVAELDKVITYYNKLQNILKSEKE